MTEIRHIDWSEPILTVGIAPDEIGAKDVLLGHLRLFEERNPGLNGAQYLRGAYCERPQTSPKLEAMLSEIEAEDNV